MVSVWTRLRSYRLGRKFESFGEASMIGRGVRIHNPRMIRIGAGCRIDDHVYLNGLGERGLTIGDRCQIRFGSLLDCWKGRGIAIGEDTFVGPLSVIQGQGGTTIGSGCLIGGQVYIVPANHVFSDSSRPIRDQGETFKGITIEDDVWIGGGVRILDGVTVGEGSVIGAGSVVTRSVSRYSVAYGVPAKVRRSR